jgi:signal transduction histidine kinase
VSDPAAIAGLALEVGDAVFSRIRLAAGHGLPERSAWAGDSAYATCLAESDRFPVCSDGRHVVLAMPLAIDRETFGEIEVVSRNAFTNASLEALVHFSRLAALLIGGSRQQAKLQRQRERFAMIARVGSIIASGIDIGELLQRAADTIHELLGYNNIAIPLIDPADRGILSIRAVGGEYKKLIRGEWRFPVSQGILGATVVEKRTHLINDVSADSRYVVTPGATGIVSELAVPIMLGDEVIGVLNVEDEKPFTREDAESLQIVAAHLAVAVNNARLFERDQKMTMLEERRRLARELHDSVTQTLASVHMIAQSLETAWRSDPELGAANTSRVVELTKAALGEMRALLHELRPADSEEDGTEHASNGMALVRKRGVVVALHQLASRIRSEALQVSVQGSAGGRLPRNVEETLYRIAQEALGNVIRHASASTVTIVIGRVGDVIHLTIEDDGRGFDPESARPAGFGLRHMRERSEALGGSCAIGPRKSGGTIVDVQIPLDGGG